VAFRRIGPFDDAPDDCERAYDESDRRAPEDAEYNARGEVSELRDSARRLRMSVEHYREFGRFDGDSTYPVRLMEMTAERIEAALRSPEPRGPR
jgi:hypothetical protein